VTRKTLTSEDQRRLVDEALAELDFAALSGEER
jgi:F-type H+-transporting ATPase subunit b